MTDELAAPVPAEPLDLPERVELTGSGLVSTALNADGLTEKAVYENRADGGVDIRVNFSLDVEPIIDRIHAEHMETGGKSKTGELWHVAELPIPLLMDLAHKLGLRSFYDLTKPEYSPYLMAMVRDSDFRNLSPTGGKA